MAIVKTYDTASHDLAESFLQDTPHLWTKDRTHRLALASTHFGDPCVHCGIPHDDVPVGPCTAKHTDGDCGGPA